MLASLSDLIGGIQYVTLSDDEAKKRGTQKSILERKAYPAFQIAIEINEQNFWTIHENIKNSIDSLLRGNSLTLQVRQLSLSQKTKIKYKKIQKNILSPRTSFNDFKTLIPYNYNNFKILNQRIRAITKKQKLKDLIIYPYSISNILVKEASYKLGFKISLVKEVKKAKIIIGLKKHLKYNFKLKRLAKKLNIPIFNLHQNSVYQLIKLFRLLIY